MPDDDGPRYTGSGMEFWTLICTVEDGFTRDALHDMAQEINEGEIPLVDAPGSSVEIGDVEKAEVRDGELWGLIATAKSAEASIKEPVHPVATLRSIADKGPEYAAPSLIKLACAWAANKIDQHDQALQDALDDAVTIAQRHDDPDEIHRELRQLRDEVTG